MDAADKRRFPESKVVLDGLLTNEHLKGIPILILGNKIDLPAAASEEELRICLGLHETFGKPETGAVRQPHVRPVETYMCSIAKKQGYGDGFRWLSQFL